VAILHGLTLDQQKHVIASFSPSPDSHNINTQLITFVRSTIQPLDPDAQPLEAFVRKWGLSHDALEQLKALPIEVQEDAMEHFNPASDTRNVSAKFLSYIKHMKTERPRFEYNDL